MDHAVVLDRRLIANADMKYVPTQHRAKPNGRPRPDNNVSDQNRVVGQKRALADGRHLVSELTEYGHGPPLFAHHDSKTRPPERKSRLPNRRPRNRRPDRTRLNRDPG